MVIHAKEEVDHPLPLFRYLSHLQKHNRLLISSGILVQHRRNHLQESIRQGAAMLGTNFNTSHTVDAHIAQGLAGIIQRNGPQGALLGADAALDAVFTCRRVECGGF